jgi:hypothetical protein
MRSNNATPRAVDAKATTRAADDQLLRDRIAADRHGVALKQVVKPLRGTFTGIDLERFPVG